MTLSVFGAKRRLGACSTALAAIDRYLLQIPGGAQQQTRRPPLLLSIDGTDRHTDGRPTVA